MCTAVQSAGSSFGVYATSLQYVTNAWVYVCKVAFSMTAKAHNTLGECVCIEANWTCLFIVWHLALNLACQLQALYITYNPDGDKFKLPYCIITFGFVQFLMSQLPDLHSLRFLNALSNFCTLTFSAIAVGMSIHTGETSPLHTAQLHSPCLFRCCSCSCSCHALWQKGTAIVI